MKTARLVHGCGADSFYATRMEVPDPYTWYRDSNGKTHAIFSTLEVDRGRKQAKVDHVHATVDIAEVLKTSNRKINEAAMIGWLIEQDGPDEIEVPSDFPAGLMVQLQQLGYTIKPVEGYFFEERIIKSAEEIEKVRKAQQINQHGFEIAFQILREAEIGKQDILYWNSEMLTAEILQGAMNARVAQEGSIAIEGGPIVGCGAQGADPHERGFGPLKAHEFIIIDSFPCGPEFYYSDLTRTVLKGTPTQWHQDVYGAVKEAQQLGLDIIKDGISGKEVHEAVQQSFEKNGFATGIDEQGNNFGFFHGTGHALGLEVHDRGPGISPRNPDALKAGMVVTVEPGLYYPGRGGVRIEDIVAVTKDGIDNLTTLPKELVID